MKPQNLKAFNLEEAKAGKPVCTRDGRPARIVDWDYNAANGLPLLTVVPQASGNGNSVHSHSALGKFTGATSDTSGLDLFMAPVTKTVWVNMYRDRKGCLYPGGSTYDTESAAMEKGVSMTTLYVGAFPITFEE